MPQPKHRPEDLNARPNDGSAPEARPDPLYFLDAQDRANYGDVILAALEDFTPGSWDIAALRLLSSHYARGKVPGYVARARTSKWIREGARHEMVIAALVMASERTDLQNPFLYIEKGLLPRWKGEVKVKIKRIPGSRGPSAATPPPRRPQIDNLDDL